MNRLVKTAKTFDRLAGRKAALKALRALRRLRNQMASDPCRCVSVTTFSYALDRFAETIDHVLPERESTTTLFVPVPRKKRGADEATTPTRPEKTVQAMCREHPQWEDFLDKLWEACKFHLAVPDDQESMTWKCDLTHSKAKTTLADMGLTSDEIERSLAYFRAHGGNCDCEVVLNVR